MWVAYRNKTLREIEMSEQDHRKPAPEGLVEEILLKNGKYFDDKYNLYFKIDTCHCGGWLWECKAIKISSCIKIIKNQLKSKLEYLAFVIIYNNEIATDEHGDCYWEVG